MMNVKQKGFTLVEIAIVLVIVGLLIGGVLKGQEMITNAKLKRIESDNAGLAAATFSYQDRYLQLPGDDSAATGRFDFYTTTVALGGAGFTVLAGEADGGGDGVIGVGTDWDSTDANDTMVAASAETSKYFGHLRAAGLIPGGAGTGTARPSNAYGGLIGIQNGSLLIAGHSTIFGQLEGAVARILEARLDDGSPISGRMQSNLAAGSMDFVAAHPLAGTTVYSEAQRYNVAFRL